MALSEFGGDRIASLGELVEILPPVARRAAELNDAIYEGGSAAGFTIIGYCDEARAPIGLIMSNDADWYEGALAPFEFLRVDNAIGSHAALADLPGELAVADLSNPARFDIDRDGSRLIEAQRRRPWGAWPIPDPAAAVAHRIGGWVDQAEVTAAGLTERRIIHWPQDRVGERIAA